VRRGVTLTPGPWRKSGGEVESLNPQHTMTTAQRAAIARRPKIRQTARTIGAAFYYYDARRSRWVIYRTAGGITRKTSLRCKAEGDREDEAKATARRLSRWPSDKLASFTF